MKGARLTPVGAVCIVGVVVGVLLLILGSTTVVQVIGLVIALCALLPILGGGLPASKRMAAFARPQMDHDIELVAGPQQDESEAEYIAETPEARASVWEHEEELYHEKQEREAHEREERQHKGEQQA
jgi:hypothetical protein